MTSRIEWRWPYLLAAAFLMAYAPLFWGLWEGPWQTEQESHGPLIIAASVWLVWRSREKLRQVSVAPAPIAGWIVLIASLGLMFLARNLGVASAEMVAAILTVMGCVLLLAGKPMLSALAFPIGFLFFAVPIPDWLIDSATIPLKVFISDIVTHVLYANGYPVAQNGVMIVIGPYQLLVKDACSGMNSILALSAIGVFYVYVVRRHAPVRAVAILLAIVPIAILANLIRVFVLVLVVSAGGIDALAGPLHPLTGIGLFVLAVLMLYLWDALLSLVAGAFSKFRHRAAATA